jgi:hypothetical protein
VKQKDFAKLLEGVTQMRRYLRGEHVRGLRVTKAERVRGKLVRTRLK